MAFEPTRTYRLVKNGEPGLSWDAEGVSLAGIALAWPREEPGASGWQARSRDELSELLGLAYGPQHPEVIDRCERGLRRIVADFETGDPALAGIEALMLRLPPIEPDRMAKLAAAEFSKGGDAWRDEARAPLGQTDGGEWTSGGATSSSGKPDQTPPPDDGSGELTVSSRTPESRRRLPNGFFANRDGGGVYHVPTTSGGHQVKPTEIHALDAEAFQVGWGAGTIELKDAKGQVFQTGASPAELEHFNATTGRTLGVSIYAYPDTPLGSPDGPLTREEQQHLADEQAAQDAGTQASIDSPSGQVTTAAGELLVQLPFLALGPLVAEAPIKGPLNTAEEVWPESEEIRVSGSRPVSQARVYENGVRAQYPEGKMAERTFSKVVDGKRVSGVADGAAEIHEETTAIESKYVANWSRSIRNPASRVGKTSWGAREQARMVAQAKKYSEHFDGGVVYHTNSKELASHFYRVFRSAGITKFRFIITPATK
jgi:hypothetical protein